MVANAGRIEKEIESMKQISLTQGLFAIVDDDNYEELSKHKWYASKIGKSYYARRDVGSPPNRKNILMHRQIMNASSDKDIHHVNNKRLDNRKSNLRECTRSQNLAAGNMNRCSKKSSIYRGVGWDKIRKKWWAKITYQGKTINLGRYNRENQAAMAYNVKALRLFGEFACLNWLRLGYE